jgi:hypothetical protein
MMFDLRKFWLGTTAFVLIIGVVIAGVCVSFNVLIGIPAKETYRQAVTQTEPIQGSTGKGRPVEIKHEPAAPAPLPVSPYVQRTPAANIALTSPQIVVPEIQIIVPERKLRR